MGQRLQLQSLLEILLGSSSVYFQPKNNVQMDYPAVVYNRDFGITEFAGNYPYRHTKRYQLTVISRTPDLPILDEILNLPMCTFDRHFVADSLNHDVFNLYF